MVINARMLGQDLAYQPILQRMQQFTQARTEETVDEVWLLEHSPVFTLGRSGKMEHVLDPGDIPVIPIDRGGQVTYHGPGQLVVYLLLDLRRLEMGVRKLVTKIEQGVIVTLAEYGVSARGNRQAPGVYVEDAKVSALGLRVSRGKTYHGLSLNINMDLQPFQRINPCGYAGLAVTQCIDLGIDKGLMEIAGILCVHLAQGLGYQQVNWQH